MEWVHLSAMALDLIAELEALIESFESGGVEYALCGGLAVAIHGHPRATMDIDVLVQAEQLAVAIQAARAAGFDIPARKMVSDLAWRRSGMGGSLSHGASATLRSCHARGS